ncbi:hypothetical protein HHI36_000783, partial [Cryptolaemus montrouzieri]
MKLYNPLSFSGPASGGNISSGVLTAVGDTTSAVGSSVGNFASAVGGTGVAVTGAAIATGVGLAYKGLKSVFKSGTSESKHKSQPSSSATLPFSNNIGPGNKPDKPRTGADAIALHHDLQYGTTKTSEDIHKADKKAISDFAYEAIYASDPISQLQAGVGSVGLGIKHTAEKATGQIIY